MPRRRPPSRTVELLADENVPHPIVERLRRDGFNVSKVADRGAGASDTLVLKAAHSANRVLITQDVDFGRLAVAQQLPVAGVVLIKLARLPLSEQVERMGSVVDARQHQLRGSFTVVEPARVRVRKLA